MKYVVITGASSGIGKEFAYFYASKGKNLILIARRTELLNQIKTDLISRYSVKIETISLDITQTENIETLIKWIKDNSFQPEILINNAGVCEAGEFASLEKEKIYNTLNLNIQALVLLCREFIPIFKENKSGKILNIASIAAFMPGPDYALYFASKAFVLNFTEALHEECKPYNISVSALCPGFVHTEMLDQFPYMGMNIADPKEIVLLGEKLLQKNKTIGINGISNQLLIFLVKLLPRTLIRKVMNYLMAKGRKDMTT